MRVDWMLMILNSAKTAQQRCVHSCLLYKFDDRLLFPPWFYFYYFSFFFPLSWLDEKYPMTRTDLFLPFSLLKYFFLIIKYHNRLVHWWRKGRWGADERERMKGGQDEEEFFIVAGYKVIIGSVYFHRLRGWINSRCLLRGDQMACQVKWFTVGRNKEGSSSSHSLVLREKLLITNSISNERRSLDKYILIISFLLLSMVSNLL